MSVEIFITGFLAASFRIATPVFLAALGETFAERSGVLNLGVEGMMVMGAFASFLTVYFYGNYWLGLSVGLIAGALFSLIHAFMSITLKVNQVVSGLAITILGLALSTFLYIGFFGRTNVVVETWAPTKIPILSEIPVIGPVLFQQHIITYFAIVLAGVSAIFLSRTTWGLVIRAVGENPSCTDSLGISVYRPRYLCTIFGGLMAGMAGTYLTLISFNSFFPNMTAGRGWIAIALVIFGHWSPSWVFGGALLYSLFDSFQLRLQSSGIPFPSQFSLMFPYLLTLIVLMLVARRRRRPAALAKPYIRGK